MLGLDRRGDMKTYATVSVLLALGVAIGAEFDAKRQHDFVKLKEFTSTQNFLALQRIEADSWNNWGIDCNYEPLTEEEQTEINELAIGLAKNLSLHATVNLEEADKPNQPQGDYRAMQTIRSLCVLRVVNNPEIIPLLIDTLRHRNDTIADDAHETLRILTRRMFF